MALNISLVIYPQEDNEMGCSVDRCSISTVNITPVLLSSFPHPWKVRTGEAWTHVYALLTVDGYCFTFWTGASCYSIPVMSLFKTVYLLLSMYQKVIILVNLSPLLFLPFMMCVLYFLFSLARPYCQFLEGFQSG